MAGQQGRQDPKEAALAAARCLNPHPEQVTDPEFRGSDFFDARDAVQVKYEMVRKVKAGGAPVTEAAAAFGYSRPAYYAAAAALKSSGLDGLVPARPGPRCARRSCRTGSPTPSACACTPARSRKRWPAAGSATPKAADLPARETRKEDDPSLSLLPSPGRAAAEPGARLDAGQDSAPGSGLDARYEQLRHAALHARAEAFPLGLGVLTSKGVTAWRHALAGLAPAATGRAAPAARPAEIPAPVAAELISALAAVALAGAITGPAPLPAVLTEGDPDAP
jgi:hypothetical protein